MSWWFIGYRENEAMYFQSFICLSGALSLLLLGKAGLSQCSAHILLPLKSLQQVSHPTKLILGSLCS